MRKQTGFVRLGILLLLSIPGLVLANIEYDQGVTPEVIFGSGNVNSNFTTVRTDGIEIGLRAKIPYAGIIYSTTDGRYHYSLADTDHDNNLNTPNRWNFDWSVNTNYDNSTGNEISEYTYELGLDSDPGFGVDYLTFDPITPTASVPFYDHIFGTNATANGGGLVAGDENAYSNYLNTKNVVQQSWRYSFFPDPPLDNYDPSIPGRYNVYLLVKDGNGVVIARNEIVVIIGELQFNESVTPDILFGTNNVNGNFTVDRKQGVEVGLRAKIPFNGNVNNLGDGTYRYSLAETDHDNDSNTDNIWNFEWSVNTNFDSGSVNNIDDYTYELGMDADPGLGVDYLIFDPITPSAQVPYFDHAIGDNNTANGSGSVATNETEYSNLISNNNVAQNSWRYAFFPFAPLDNYNPNVPGTYDVYLSVLDSQGEEVARTEIQVLIEDATAYTVPQTFGDSYQTNEDMELIATTSVLANDIDADGQTLQIVNPGVFTANGIGGEISITSDGLFIYNPPQDLNGIDEFNYMITDGTTQVASVLTIQVNAVNDAPNFSIGGDVVVSSLDEDNDLVIFDNFTFDYDFGPVDENSQSIEQFIVNVASDSSGVIEQIFVTNDAYLVVDFTTNLGTALVEISLQDDGGTAFGGDDTSMTKLFSVSYLDIIFLSGFDSENPFNILNFIETIKIDSVDKSFVPGPMDRPYYDSLSHSVYFLSHKFSLQDNSQPAMLKAALMSWMHEVIVNENLPLIITR